MNAIYPTTALNTVRRINSSGFPIGEEMTKIEWTEMSWNPVVGCTKVSAGCQNCYAEKMAYRLSAMGVPCYDMVQEEGQWNSNVEIVPNALEIPFHWRKPRKIFVCSMGDLFHKDVPFEFIDKVFRVIRRCPQHTFQVLTKRPKRMAEYFDGLHQDYQHSKGIFGLDATGDINEILPLKNFWLGVSVENNKNLWRIDELVKIQAAIHYVSFEPLLGRIDLGFSKKYFCPDCNDYFNNQYCAKDRVILGRKTPLDWAIFGCESGSNRRPCKIEWVRDIVNQCKAANVPIFVKQLSINGKVEHDINKFPIDLQVQDYPKENQ